MYFTSFLVLSASVAAVVGAPFTFPTADGFPRPNRTQLALIQQGAGGTLSNAFLPMTLKSATIAILELLANNEIFEVVFFTQLLTNITTNVPGYDAAATAPLDRDYLIKAISTIVNQEKLHALGARGILAGAGQPVIEPCQYDFPVSNFKEAILLAQTFTDIALGTLPEVQEVFATEGSESNRTVRLLGSILAQEGQQDGFFRFIQQKTPSAAPYLTGGSAGFAFTALQAYIVPGSCPKPLSTIDLPTFKPLNILTKPMARNMTLEYSVDGEVSCKDQSVVYLSGQNLPVRVPISCSSVKPRPGGSTFKADFPFLAGFSNGLSIAVVVVGTTGQLLDPNEVAKVAVYAPGLIEVN
ncbi:MAG: hypothetical protein Q9185_006998 [Variospora sp. 1 TL-2023]